MESKNYKIKDERSRGVKAFQNIVLFIIAVFFCLLLFELGIRAFITPSPKCYGVLWGRELPPFNIKIGSKFHVNYDQWVDEIIVNGQKMTKGDLWGIMEQDPVLGYAPQKKAVSRNRWWQSNSLGARSRQDFTKNILPGKQRVIIFGESYANCSRVPQEETWPDFLSSKNRDVEFVNFGVDGYSMSQCLLRYESLKNRIDYDIVMLVFVPGADLWRDLNVLRQLNGWQNYPLIPRFVVNHDQLDLPPSPYKRYEDLERENSSYCSDVLRKYLRAYDRLYFTAQYESPLFLGNLIIYKLFAKTIYQSQKQSLLKNVMRIDSEAMMVVQKIFEHMNSEAKSDKKRFILVYLPRRDDLEKYKFDNIFHQQYDEMVSLSEKNGITCINLMGDFLKLQEGKLDAACDGVHYGPETNKIISEMLWKRLKINVN